VSPSLTYLKHLKCLIFGFNFPGIITLGCIEVQKKKHFKAFIRQMEESIYDEI